MNTAELKSDLHRLIVETNDIDILFAIRQYLLQLQNKEVDWWDTITDKQKSSIQNGIDQLNQGKRISNQEVRQKINNLLNSHD